MNETTSYAPAPAKLQTNVSYLPGVTIAGSKNGLLEWSADDHVKLFITEPGTGVATEVIFDVPLKDIEKVKGGIAMLTLVIANESYNIQFSQTAAAKLAVGGGLGLGFAYRDTRKSGITVWIQTLRDAGVNVAAVKDWNWVVKAALIGTGVCTGIAVIVTCIVIAASF